MDLVSHHRWPWRRITAALVVPVLGVIGASCADGDSSESDAATGVVPTSTQPSETSTVDTITAPPEPTTPTTTEVPDTSAVVEPPVVEQTTRSGEIGVSVFGVDHGLPQEDLDAVVIAPDGVVWAGTPRDGGWIWAHLVDGRFVDVAVSPAWGSQFAAGLDGELWMFGPSFFGSPGVQHFDGTDWAFDPEAAISYGVVNADGTLHGFDVATEGINSLEPSLMSFAAFDSVSWTQLPTPPRPVSNFANPAIAPDGAVWVQLDRRLGWFDGQAWTSTVDLDPVAAEAFLHVLAGEFRLGVDGTAWMLYEDDEFGPSWLRLADGAVERRAIDVAGLEFDEECSAGDAAGRLPLSTDPTVALIDLNALVAGFAGDVDGQLWTATTCLGVTRTDPGASEASVFTTEDGLPSLGFRDIAAHPDGSVWVATDSGLVRLAPLS